MLVKPLRLNRLTFGTLKYLVLTIYAMVTAVPFLWVLITSFKDNDEMYSAPFGWPKLISAANYIIAWQSANISTYLLNSLMVSVAAVVIVLLVGSMAAYVLARIRPNKFLYTYFTLGITIPVHTILIPTFILMKNLNLLNSLFGLILLYAIGNLSLAIFIMVGFLRSIPKEIEEAAYIDGSSMTRTFFQIVFPLSRPGLATVGILTFLNCWNEYLFAYVLITDATRKTITQGIYSLQGVYSTSYGPLMAGLVMSIVPVIIVYLVFQEQVIEGMTVGAVKG